MTLEQVAQQAMKYLDDVGVAADWGIEYMHLVISTEKHIFTHAYDESHHNLMNDIIYIYPQKSPA